MTQPPLRWKHLVATVDDLKGYKHVVRSMFADGIVNEGRCTVLRVFTHDVCLRVKDPSSIRKYYAQSILPKLHLRLQRNRSHNGSRPVVLTSLVVCMTCAALCWWAAGWPL